MKHVGLKDSFIYQKLVNKTFLLVISSFFISLLIRIDRIGGPNGIDGIYLLWEADRFADGSLIESLIHPLSYIGGYPHSPYPILSVIILSGIRIITNYHLEVSIFIFNSLFILISILTSFKLFNEIFNDEKLAVIGSIIYTNIPFFLLFSYTNVSARTPYIAIFPLLIYYYTMIVNSEDFSIEFTVKATLLTFISLYLHRMSLVGIILLFGSLLLRFFKTLFEQFTEYKLFELITYRIISIISIILFLLAYTTAGIIGDSSINYTQFIDLNLEYFNFYIRMFSTHYQKSGTILFIALFSVILFLIKEPEFENDNKIKTALIFQIPFLNIIGNVVYVSYFLTIPLIIFTLMQLVTLKNIKGQLVMIILLIIFQFGTLIFLNSDILKVDGYIINFGLIVFVIVALLGIIQLRNPLLVTKNMRTIFLSTFIVFILFNSLFLLDFSLEFTVYDHPYSPGEILNEEQRQLGEFFANMTPATIWTYSRLLTSRIGLISNWLQVDDLHSSSLLILDYYSPKQVHDNSELKDTIRWTETRIYESQLPDGRNLHSILLGRSVLSIPQRDILTRLNVPFFVAFRNSNVAEFWPGNFGPSVFVESLKNYTIMVHETQNFQVFDLRPYLDINYTTYF